MIPRYHSFTESVATNCRDGGKRSLDGGFGTFFGDSRVSDPAVHLYSWILDTAGRSCAIGWCFLLGSYPSSSRLGAPPFAVASSATDPLSFRITLSFRSQRLCKGSFAVNGTGRQRWMLPYLWPNSVPGRSTGERSWLSASMSLRVRWQKSLQTRETTLRKEDGWTSWEAGAFSDHSHCYIHHSTTVPVQHSTNNARIRPFATDCSEYGHSRLLLPLNCGFQTSLELQLYSIQFRYRISQRSPT